MTNMEEFFRENKHSFDQAEPDKLKIWKGIEDKLPKSQGAEVKYLRRMRFWQFAAIFLFLVMVGGTYIMYNNHSMNIQMAQDSQINDIHAYYSQLVNYKIEQVQMNNVLSKSDKEEIYDYLDELEYECNQLEEEFKKNIDNEAVIKAIVNNYRKRIDLLESLLLRVNEKQIVEHEESIAI